jgi:ATP-dependent DNA ligase
MPKYNTYRYIFPPRPENCIPDTELEYWDNGSLLAQVKINGSNTTIYTNGIKVITMNRHGERLTSFKLTDEEVKNIYRGNGEWVVINGEYMNKSKLDENRKVFNHKFVIFDILAFNGEYMVGKTFQERVDLLDELYGTKDSEKEDLYFISENIYRVKSYYKDFKNIYDRLCKIDMYEGIVFKRKNAKLEMGNSEKNNVKSQLKCRKPTKNYKY